MGAMSNSSSRVIEGINITPLVDIVLVLLVVFIVSAKLVSPESIELELPQATTGEASNAFYVIRIDADSQILVEGQEMSLDALEADIRTALEENHELRALIDADRRVAHGEVVNVMDLLRELHIYRIAFGTRRVQEQSSPSTALEM